MKSFLDLQSYILELRKRGQLQEISVSINPRLELAEVHRRVIQEQGKALLFTNVQGSTFPVATNLFGTRERVELAFGTEIQKVISRAANLPHELGPKMSSRSELVSGLWANRDLVGKAFKLGLKRVGDAPIKERLKSPAQLTELPIITTWLEDGGPFVTLPLVYTEHPELKVSNLGMYRLQRFSDTETGLHMQIGKGGGFHLSRAKELGQKLPVNVFLGGPPAMILAAIAPLPENVPEVLLASLLTEKKLRLSDNPIGPLPLLADAEFVFVGTCDPNERRPEGPFGDHYGYYSLKHDYPVFRCDGVFHRRNAIYPATVVGKPRQEDFYIGNYLQEMLSPLFPLVMPAVKDLWSYGETGYHSLAGAVVQERYKREVLVSAFRILGEGQLALTKFLLLTNKSVNLKNFRETLECILERCDFRTDLFVFSNLSMDTLDYTGPTVNEGSKGVMVGVGEPIRTLPGEFNGELPSNITHARVFCRGCLCVSGREFSKASKLPEQIANSECFKDWPLVVLVDDADDAVRTEESFLWTTFTRFEPAADIYAARTELHRYHPTLHPPIIIDARMKPNYPAELICDPDTTALVDQRWKEYFSH